MRKALILAPLLLAGCISGGPIIASANSCPMLIPDTWREPVAPPPLPDGLTVGDWIAFADALAGKLDIANGQKADTLTIIERCTARDAEAVQRPRFLGVF